MKKFYALFLGLLFIVSCNKSDDNPGGPNPDPNANVTVQDFMWKAMNLWYFWQSDVPDLADDRFSTTQEYTNFLATTADPSDFYFDRLLFNEDRFSFLNSDYTELTQNLSGISRSNGLEFGLLLYQDSDDLFGYVRYIIPDSDASTKDISRGEIFTGVDGQTLNISNYRDLLFGENATYTLNMADIGDSVISPNGKEVELTKQEGLVENPVFIANTLDVNGQKVAYLMYNGFTNEFDEELNAAFGMFNAEGATELVLDLRYNGGGSVNTSRLLASMIYGTYTQQLYIKQRWNEKLLDVFDPEDLKDYFASATGSGSQINTMNLSRVYVLVTNSSASASELVINGLNPYIDVILIGGTTRGKNEFSLTMVDDPGREGAPYIYTASRESQINPENSWAIQPLVGRNENSVGFSDYTDGFMANIELPEDLENLGVLGDPNEPLLARALEEIDGAGTKRDFTVGTPIDLYTSSRMFQPIKDNMILDKPLNIQFEK
ncbi:MAG: carboxyl-terminal protease [Eudoraea sp.]|nr:carboxyl-terminal protease [Eudoraea sp.]